MKTALWSTILLTAIFYSNTNIYGQEKKIVVVGAINKIAIDTNEIISLNKQATTILEKDTNKALLLLQKALHFSKHANYTRGMALSYHNIAHYYNQKKQFEHAIAYEKLSLQQYILLRQKIDILNSYLSLSTLYTFVADYPQVKALYNRAAGFVNTQNKQEMHLLSKLRIRLGSIYVTTGNYDSASYHYQKVVEANTIADTANYLILAYAYNGLGIVNNKIDNYANAELYYKKAEQLGNICRDSGIITISLCNAGAMHYNNKNYKACLSSSAKALAIARKKSFLNHAAVSAYNIALILITENKPQEALPYSIESYNYGEKTKQPKYAIIGSYILGNNYVALKQYDKAIKYLVPALEKAKETGQIDNIANAYDRLAAAYAGLKQYDKAFQYSDAYVTIRDSLQSKEVAEKITNTEMQYKTAEKDKEITEKKLLLSQQQNKLKEKNIWLISISACALLLTTILIGIYTRKKHKEHLQQERIVNMEQTQEILMLKARMDGEEAERARLARDLHDGIVVHFSAVKMNLSVLPEEHQSLLHSTDFKRIIEHLDNATSELRKTAHNLLPDALLEGGLSEAIYYFCNDIEKSTGLTIDYQQYVDLPRFIPTVELSIYRIVQELLQNICKHAKATNVIVQISLAENILNITVEDNGIGYNDGNVSKNSIGIKNIRNRVAALNGHLDIEGRPNMGTTVYMELNIQKLIA